jgi:hypothetical protein
MTYLGVAAGITLLASVLGEGYFDFQKELNTEQAFLKAIGTVASEVKSTDTAQTRKQIIDGAMKEYESAVGSTLGLDAIHFVRDLGISLAVALALIIGVEAANSRRAEAERETREKRSNELYEEREKHSKEEYRRREERAQEVFEERLRTMSTRVLSAVYQRDHPNDLFKVIQEKIFAADLVRREVEVVAKIYSLTAGALLGSVGTDVEKLRVAAGKKGLNPDQWIVLQIEMRFKVKNTSSVHDVSFTPPFRMERKLPLDKSAWIESIQVDRVELLQEPWFEVSKETPNMVAYKGQTRQLKPGKECEILMRGGAIRAVDDDEMWISRFISETTKVTLRDCTTSKLYMEMCSLSLYPEAEHERHVSNLSDRRVELFLPQDRVLLPFQGVQLKWCPFDRYMAAEPAAEEAPAVPGNGASSSRPSAV